MTNEKSAYRGSSFVIRHWDIQQLLLLQVFLDPFRLPQQERGVLIRRVDRAVDEREVLLELFREFLLFLIPPGGAERVKLAGERRHPPLQLGVEELELMSKSAQFGRVDNGLRHARSLLFCSGFRGERAPKGKIAPLRSILTVFAATAK